MVRCHLLTGGRCTMQVVKEWEIEIAGPHTVRVEHNTISGKLVISLDGEEILRRPRKFWDTGCEHRFTVDGTRCLVRVVYITYHCLYELWVDGKLQ